MHLVFLQNHKTHALRIQKNAYVLVCGHHSGRGAYFLGHDRLLSSIGSGGRGVSEAFLLNLNQIE